MFKKYTNKRFLLMFTVLLIFYRIQQYFLYVSYIYIYIYVLYAYFVIFPNILYISTFPFILPYLAIIFYIILIGYIKIIYIYIYIYTSMGYRLFRRPQVSFVFATVFVCWGLCDCGVASLWFCGLVFYGFCGFVGLCACDCLSAVRFCVIV